MIDDTGVLPQLSAALINRYTIVRELGAGGMATVYLAHDIKHDRNVAVKVLRPELAAMLGARRFLSEINVTARLQHPNLLPLFDSGDAGGLLYYVMPYIEGESLRARLDREAVLPIDEALQIATALAAALDYAHQQGIVHRDIKPENILLHDGHPLLADFGIALAVSEAGGERLTRTGVSIGTPQYMSPEQATGGAAVDGRSDVYSLAAVTYEMLSGEPPHAGRSAQQVIARLLTEKPRSLRAQRPNVNAQVESVIARGLEKLPADRWTRAGDFAAALDAATTRRFPALPSLSPRTRRNVLRTTAILIVAGVGAWFLRERLFGAPRLDSLAVLPFQNASRDSTQDYFVDGMHEAIIGELSRISALTLVSRTSTLQYRGSRKTAREIARELGVKVLVEGSVARSGDSVHVQVRLIQLSPRERTTWRGGFDKPMRSVLVLQRDVAAQIAHNVKVVLTPSEHARFETAAPIDPTAYDTYLKASMLLGRGNPASMDSAVPLLERVLEKEPLYAPAHIAIATIWIRRSNQGFVAPKEAWNRADAHIRRAIEIDSASAGAHYSQAKRREWLGDWAAADSEYRRAIRLDPNWAGFHTAFARLLAARRHPEEAIREAQLAIKLDAGSAATLGNYGIILLNIGRPREAVEQFEKALQENPKADAFQPWQAYRVLGKLDSAQASAEKYFAAVGRQDVVAAMRQGQSEAGYRMAMQRAAEQLVRESKTRRVREFWVATLYEHAGDKQRAIDWFERAVDAGDNGVFSFAVIPQSVSLRNEPRWRALMKRMNLE
jgi:serine/threonine-protein kinase